MGFYVSINYNIKGQVDDWSEQDIIRAKLDLICAQHNLKVEETEEEF